MDTEQPTDHRSDPELEKIQALLLEHESLIDAYQSLEKLLLGYFDSERMSIFQRRRQHQDLVARFKTGNEVKDIKVPIGPQSIAGYVGLSQRPLLISDPYDDEELYAVHPKLRFAKQFDKSSNYRTRNILCVPIKNAGVLLGCFQVLNKKSGWFSQEDIDKASALAEILGEKFRFELGGTSSPFQYLVHRNFVSPKQLVELQQNTKDHIEFIDKLTKELRIPEGEIGQALSVHHQVPFINFSPDKFHLHQSNNKLNISYLKRNYVAVIADAHEKPVVVMAEPNNAELLMEIERATRLDHYEICVALPNAVLQYLGADTASSGNVGDMDEILDDLDTNTEESDDSPDDLSDDAPAVVRLVSRVLQDAKRMNASDIHIDPEKGGPTRVRMRIDGVCRDMSQVPASHHSAMVARIKIMANLNIAEKRIPQDGKLAFKLNGQLVEVRVATIPTVAGEGIVMRILATGGAMPLSKMNVTERNTAMLEEMIVRPHGILLVVGPTGSGKTTTLHAILGHLNTPDKKIWTAEDPVEITQAGLQQVQVQPKINFTFATALRAFLRADPDIILIGEMRDKETAHAGIEASLTGHLVLSTLHTNSAPETITRLLDLGLDPVNFSDACVGILAQRLIRTLCPSCKEEYTPTAEEMAFLRRQYGDEYWDELKIPEGKKLHRAVGCDVCGDSGYKGRTGVHELLTMTPALRALVYKESAVTVMKDQAMADGMRTLAQDGIFKVLKGDTDIAQIQALTSSDH